MDKSADNILKEQLLTDFRLADITDEDKRILEYAEKITLDASSIDQAYVNELRDFGMSGQMLHDIVQVAAYFNYVNRLADGLGIEIEDT